MLQKLDGLEDRKYAGYCLEVEVPHEPTYQVISIRPLQQGLTKPHPQKPQYARPLMYREPLDVTIPLPWDNCYHPTCYDVCVRVPTERRDYSFDEDDRYEQLLRAGLDDDQILRVLDGQEDPLATDVPDEASETDSLASPMFLAKVPSSDKLEHEPCFVPVMRIDHILSNVPEIADPSQLRGDLDLFQEIVHEYQLARYGSVLFDPQEDPPIDDTPVRSAESRASSTEDLSSDSPDSHELHSLSEQSPQVPVPVSTRKGKLRVRSLLQKVITNFVEVFKRPKVSRKL
ncbi:uncharacterized protein BT62DRAFT_924202 [Guyanagaster necrorhizus]|uniref:Uncharacterized protein n=1 Tax=Guyanagaster necrorhizus TaxID=856835 RepID=A0A9P8ALH4_9AGAR|nr:uncharacterized protein BT62DRAFT_924202 [Guyanagaster necrorhizus MCA 3950]KAG7440208.1 hypothetical protein BT62DRAFT_924202 [Guyanagaster necrorhizus MCA 3950]